MLLKGKVWRFADHIDTDLIIPARYLNVSDKNILAGHAFADLRPEFAREVKPGDIIVSGINFGCGSSREHAPLALKAAGISAIIAPSFARIFYRNSFNIGLPLLECAEASDKVKEGDILEIDTLQGLIQNLTQGGTYQSQSIPPFMQQLIDAGGLVNQIRTRVQAQGQLSR
ncbi:MAG: 3-isopropylmalate dehydratase small subunit [Deltaproteobacteria bacterium]|nr:3-isopropylmalate dehydratase small subunit [Deltaproteobacteria bacterium]